MTGARGRVCHFSSVHPANDIRVYHKECVTLAHAGFDVALVAVEASVPAEPVRVIALPETGGRLRRMLLRSRSAYRAALRERAAIYHFHDPELLPWAWLLKLRTGARVVYDSHENYVEDIHSKVWLPSWIRSTVARVFYVFESLVVRQLDLVVAATPHIADRFAPVARRVETINNYPKLEEFQAPSEASGPRDAVCYVGAITFARGIVQMLDALDHVDGRVRFELAGRFANAAVERAAREHRNWGRVAFHGQVGRDEVAAILARSFAGLVTLRAVPNHIYAQPIKLFEYMSAGIPAIASDFPSWRAVVVDGDCGLAVDPESSISIAAAINRLATDESLCRKLGENGKRLVRERYNWNPEGRRLVTLYDELLDSSS